MDSVRANQMAQDLIGHEVGGWKILNKKGNGKSALVMTGEKDGQVAAVKVFDPELVERFGRESQITRINRELELKEHDCEHLIRILDGGECGKTGYLYLVMELHEWPSLDEVVDNIPSDKIWLLIELIAGAAEYLEKQGIVHRDIKPSNIIVSPDFTDARLLDLGVIRPIGDSDLTDIEQKIFIGTLRYSSPEWLLRHEVDSEEGWRAVTFYQLGGVLHDVIMRKPIFDEYSEPWARLVHAVDKEIPVIKNDSVDPDLVFLAKNCLMKNPDLRCKMVTWDSFKKVPVDISESINIKHRILQRKKAASLSENDLQAEKEARINSNKAGEILNQIGSVIRKVRIAAEYLPPSEQKIRNQPDKGKGYLLLQFNESVKYAVPLKFTILLVITIVDSMGSVVDVSYQAKYGNEVSNEAPDVIDEEDLEIVYEGVLDEGVLTEKIEGIFLCVVDIVQQK